MGNRLKNIYNSLSLLLKRTDIQLLKTSFLYESLPMYVTDQSKFLNAAVLVILFFKFLDINIIATS